MKTIYKIALSVFCTTSCIVTIFGQQSYINREWENTTGTVGAIHRTTSILDNFQNLIVACNTVNGAGNSDVLITKYDADGLILWQQTYNGSANGNDYAVQLAVNSSNEIFIAAALTQSAGVDFGLIKYSPTGSLLFSTSWGGSANGMDIPADLKIDGSGNVYLAGVSQSTIGTSDYGIVKFNVNGIYQWHTTYDFANLHDAATSLAINGSSLVVTGASASAPTNWDYATLEINTSNGTITNTQRTVVPGVGLDNAVAVTIDGNNNTFITGYVEVNGNRNIQTVKINSTFGLDWVKNFDGGLEDVGKAIGVDNFGNVYITGSKENPNGGKDYITIKYDQSGIEIWLKEFGSEGNNYEASAENLAFSSNGDIFITGSVDKSGVKEFATVCYTPSGELKVVEKFDAGNQNNEAKSILVSNNDIYVSGVSEVNGITQNATLKYTQKEKPLMVATDATGANYNANELLIRFDKTAINYAIIDDKRFTAGVLSDFVKPSVINALNQKTGFDWTKLDAFKIFLRMTTADSISITRLGDTTRLDDFWATISVYIPFELNEQQIVDSISTLYPLIQYAERDFFAEFHSAPNDSLYSTEMVGLYNPLNGIEVETAWDKQVGQTYTKVGVFDTGINWRHEDYGDGTSSGTKVVGGWDFYNNVSPFSQVEPDVEGHGTATSGLIGALRNNNIGISGVAGGDVQSGNTGCQLFSMAIPVSGQVTISTLHSIAGPAIVEGASYNPSTGYGYGLHIQNHSWGSTTNTNVLRDAVKSCYQNNCVFVASSGNDGNATINYPASYKDEWVLKIGANDGTGDRASFSTYGNDLDVIAPGTNDLYMVLDNTNNTGYIDLFEDVDINGNPVFIDVNGTSFAAPMASGSCALLYSEHNTNNGYPNNLAPEDVEAFINSFKTDVPPAGYDQETGHGRINTNYALEKLMLPQYFVKHSGGQNNMTSIPSYNIQVFVANNINGVAAGYYWADRYQVTNTFLDIFSPTQTVISDWPRNSSSIGVSASNTITGDTYFSYTSTISQNVASVTTTTFCWYITTNLQVQAVNKWIPAPPSQLRTAYSLYVKDNAVTGIEENELGNGFNIYPNPSNSQITIEYILANEADSEVEIYDATGKLIAKHALENQNSGNHSVTINISHLADGLYLCNLKIGDQVISKRIVKN